MQHLTPFHWLLLCGFTGLMGALGQLLCKDAGKTMPPYVIIGLIGVMWALPPVVLMGVGPSSIGVHAVMSLGQAASLGMAVIGPVLVVGFLFWLDNLARFDAINKASYVAYVLVLLELSAMATAFLLEIGWKAVNGQPFGISWYDAGGVALAFISLLFFKGMFSAERQEVKHDRPHFTPLRWQTLCLIGGALAAVGQLIGKDVGPVMPPYVLTGIVGFVWVACSVVYMSLGRTWDSLRFPKTMSLGAMFGLGATVLLPVFVAGFMFWVENLSRFDAINKAPYLGYVLVAIPVANAIFALSIESVQKLRRGEPASIGRNELLGLLFAAASIALFAIAPAR